MITTTSSGTTSFLNTSTAGNAVVTNAGGLTRFDNMSTAGVATITNSEGIVEFFKRGTAGTATITTNNRGSTFFHDPRRNCWRPGHISNGECRFQLNRRPKMCSSYQQRP